MLPNPPVLSLGASLEGSQGLNPPPPPPRSWRRPPTKSPSTKAGVEPGDSQG